MGMWRHPDNTTFTNCKESKPPYLKEQFNKLFLFLYDIICFVLNLFPIDTRPLFFYLILVEIKKLQKSPKSKKDFGLFCVKT
ncbi:hypothetical protein CN609_10510 [Bacillus wiedmannii]|nr:hypothetical protein CN609_10510 [Bacillus wiedmannii]